VNAQECSPGPIGPPDYNALVMEHFERPRNSGRFEAAADVVEGIGGQQAQGAAFRLSARIVGQHIGAMRFEVYGCPHCVAASSWLTQRLQGATLDDLRAWSWREAADALQIPPEKRGRLLILEDAVRALAEAWRDRT